MGKCLPPFKNSDALLDVEVLLSIDPDLRIEFANPQALYDIMVDICQASHMSRGGWWSIEHVCVLPVRFQRAFIFVHQLAFSLFLRSSIDIDTILL